MFSKSQSARNHREIGQREASLMKSHKTSFGFSFARLLWHPCELHADLSKQMLGLMPVALDLSLLLRKFYPPGVTFGRIT